MVATLGAGRVGIGTELEAFPVAPPVPPQPTAIARTVMKQILWRNGSLQASDRFPPHNTEATKE